MIMLELKVPPLVLVLLSGAAMWLISLAAPSFTWQLVHGKLVALVFALSGGIVAVLGVVAFRQAQTTVNPTKPEATSSLVREGVYRLSRNPMYLGFLLALLGLALLLANTLSFAIIPLFVIYMNRFQIIPEERALSAAFGQEFTTYKQKVRRWF
jgi:protein-S-isoprenylcysteine O-methyltransferase Ste14